MKKELVTDMKQDWRIYAKKADFNALAARFGIDPVLARIIRNRDVITEKEYEEYLFGTLDSVHSPETMMDIELGADIIASSIEAGESIRIVGDYDVDGVMSTCILFDALNRANARVSYTIPHRVNDGYGINEQIIQKAYEDGIDTILTCDNGIAAVSAIEKAVELGLTVVVTDHHEVQPVIPEADAIIDPHQDGDEYPYSDICGALVAYKFVQVLYDRMGMALGRYDYLEEVALATVCDVMPLLDENRIYVREGLKRLEVTEKVGLKALIKVQNLEGKKLTGYHLGFVLGPTINAAGKLGDATDAVELLLCENESEALKRAEAMKELNDSRKAMTEEGEQKAIEIIEKQLVSVDGEEVPKDDVLLIYIPDLHEGLAGIVAGRIRERYYRPTIIFTDTDKDPSILKGSGRSTDSYNMFEKINVHKDMLVKFGGHPLAAGLSIERDKLDEFRKILNDESGLTETDKIPKLMIDVPMPISYASMKLAEQISSLEPFGKGNESPLFAEKALEILGYKIFGQQNNAMKLKVRGSRGIVSEILYFRPQQFENDIKRWFGDDICDKIKNGVYTGCKLDIAYEVGINEYNGGRYLQLIMKTYDKS
ncbi:MAG: single-stranded-DNA-specific exonuclease RecJ [Eubacterium sp.]|nr:single-stranded-DNA-specific exonuclease RecJ [Eubacterium sp.]